MQTLTQILEVKNHKIQVVLPNDFKANKVKVTITSEDNSIKKKPSDFRGILNKQETKELLDYVAKSREEWNKDTFLDTNSIIYYLGNDFSENINLIIDNISQNISIITKMEVLGWYNAPSNKISDLREYINSITIIELNEEIAEQTILLRQKHKIKLPDAIIASTALVNDFILITRNTKDFKKIEGLKLIDPYELK